MAYQATTLHLLISCPGDVTNEDREVIHRSVNRWNFNYGQHFQLTVLPIWWGSTPLENLASIHRIRLTGSSSIAQIWLLPSFGPAWELDRNGHFRAPLKRSNEWLAPARR